MRISDWSSDVCSSDLRRDRKIAGGIERRWPLRDQRRCDRTGHPAADEMPARDHAASRSDRASVPPARLPDADLGPDIELPAIEIAIIARREGRPLVGAVVDARPQREIRKLLQHGRASCRGKVGQYG